MHAFRQCYPRMNCPFLVDAKEIPSSSRAVIGRSKPPSPKARPNFISTIRRLIITCQPSLPSWPRLFRRLWSAAVAPRGGGRIWRRDGGVPACCFWRMISAADSLARCISVPVMALPFFCSRRGWSADMAGEARRGRWTTGTYLSSQLLLGSLTGLVALVSAGHGWRTRRCYAVRWAGEAETSGWRAVRRSLAKEKKRGTFWSRGEAVEDVSWAANGVSEMRLSTAASRSGPRPKRSGLWNSGIYFGPPCFCATFSDIALRK